MTLEKFEVYKVENGWVISSDPYSRMLPDDRQKAWIAHTPQALAAMIVELVTEKPKDK